MIKAVSPGSQESHNEKNPGNPLKGNKKKHGDTCLAEGPLIEKGASDFQADEKKKEEECPA